MDERITSRKNILMTHVRKLTSSRKYRRESGEYLGDGVKLLEEACKCGAPITCVIAVDDLVLPALPEGTRLVRVPEDVMASISPMESPQGALFMCRMDAAQAVSLTGNRYLVLDGVQDPGNVGTIWRSADALSADGIMLTNGCADPWNWKTVRATMGACFRLPIYEVEDIAQTVKENGLNLYATALREDTEDIRDVNLGRAAVVIGSEGKGVSDAVLALCEKTIKIPMRERCESLNAAAAATIVLWEMGR